MTSALSNILAVVCSDLGYMKHIQRRKALPLLCQEYKALLHYRCTPQCPVYEHDPCAQLYKDDIMIFDRDCATISWLLTDDKLCQSASDRQQTMSVN